MSQTNLIKELRDSAAEILNAFSDLISNGKSRDFNDINKRARENELTLYTLVSENVPVELYTKISMGLEQQVLNSIRSILSTTVNTHPMLATKFVLNNFTNNADVLSKLKNDVTAVGDSLGENVAVDLDLRGVNLIFNENDSSPVARHTDLRRHPATRERRLDGETEIETSIALDKGEKEAMRIPGTIHHIDVKYTSTNNEVLVMRLAVFIRVRIIPIESKKIIDTIVSSKERNNFFAYLKWRAGKQSFFRDFVVNLNEIHKQVKRDTSQDLEDRILGSLLSRGGFTRPKALSDSTELKNFILVLSNEELERLSVEHSINILKGPTLKQIFTNMNIMSLMVVDNIKKKVYLFESDKPTEMTVISLADMSDAMKLAKLFQNINK